MRLVLILLIWCSFLFSNSLQKAKVVRVVDGDTLYLKKYTNVFKVRLIAIDTFETKVNHRAFIQLDILKNINRRNRANIKQVLKYGYIAKTWVKKKFLYKEVEFISFGKDKYNRTLVWISGINFGLVRRGLAIYYPNNKIDNILKKALLEASKSANLEKRGIYGEFK